MTETAFPPTENIPSWAKWIAQDSDGTWWGFETEPNVGTISWYENEVGQIVRLGQEPANPDWKQTLHSAKALKQQASAYSA